MKPILLVTIALMGLAGTAAAQTLDRPFAAPVRNITPEGIMPSPCSSSGARVALAHGPVLSGENGGVSLAAYKCADDAVPQHHSRATARPSAK